MSHIRKFNEGLFWTNKDDLYLKNKLWETRSSQPETIIGFEVHKASLESCKKLNTNDIDGGNIGNLVERGNKILFRSNKYSDETWLDSPFYIKKLYKVSEKLGFAVGKRVHDISNDKKSLGDGVITDIKPLVFYKNTSGLFDEDSNFTVLTLLYRVSYDGKLRWCQVYEIDLLKLQQKNMTIVDGEIEDSFIDFIDRKELKFYSTSFYSGGLEQFNCKILINISNPSLLADFTSVFNTMSKRLDKKGIEVSIDNFNKDGITFVCKQK